MLVLIWCFACFLILLTRNFSKIICSKIFSSNDRFTDHGLILVLTVLPVCREGDQFRFKTIKNRFSISTFIIMLITVIMVSLLLAPCMWNESPLINCNSHLQIFKYQRYCLINGFYTAIIFYSWTAGDIFSRFNFASKCTYMIKFVKLFF